MLLLMLLLLLLERNERGWQSFCVYYYSMTLEPQEEEINAETKGRGVEID
jgi:hypothetical protein